jgi:hypothetical protein
VDEDSTSDQNTLFTKIKNCRIPFGIQTETTAPFGRALFFFLSKDFAKFTQLKMTLLYNQIVIPQIQNPDAGIVFSDISCSQNGLTGSN